jgi:hypothetical protein
LQPTALGKQLKATCRSRGTAKNGVIEVQGDPMSTSDGGAGAAGLRGKNGLADNLTCFAGIFIG